MKKKIFIISLISFILDRLLKSFIISFITYQESIYLINNFFYLTYVKNTGGAWSILSGNTFLLLIIGLIAIGILIYYLLKKEEFSIFEIISFGLLIGGILGNFIDRLIYKGVIDYIGLIFGKYYFPIFNLADICIVVGTFILIIDTVRSDFCGNRSNKR